MENQTNQSTEETNVATVETTINASQNTINQISQEAFLEKMKSEQNLVLGISVGLAAAVLGAVLWAAITVTTNYQIGYMAVAIGFLVGYAVRTAGKGVDPIFGISGAVLAIFGCLFGNFLSIIGYIANSENIGYFETFSMIDYSLIPEVMMEAFSPIDILFYGIAVYEGYKFSFRRITEEEIATNNIAV